VVCSNNDAIWHRFRYVTTFAVYATDCDLEKSYVLEQMAGITSHVRLRRFKFYVSIYRRIYTAFSEVCEIQRFQTAKVTSSRSLKVSIMVPFDRIQFLLVFSCNYASILHRFGDIITYFTKFKQVT